MQAQKVYITMMEVSRRFSEPGALDITNKENFQRQRSSNTNWLDWSVDCKGYLNEMSWQQVRAMEVVYWKADKVTGTWALKLAAQGLDKWFNLLPDDLKEYGKVIAGKL